MNVRIAWGAVVLLCVACGSGGSTTGGGAGGSGGGTAGGAGGGTAGGSGGGTAGGSGGGTAGGSGGGTAGGSGGGTAGGSGGGTAGGSGGGTAGGSGGSGGGTAGGSGGSGGSGGGTAGGSGGSGGGTAGGGGSGGAGGGTSPLAPRLVVSTAGGGLGVRLWNNANTLTTDVAASATLAGIGSSPFNLLTNGQSLFVVSNGGSGTAGTVLRFDGPLTLATAAMPTGQIPGSVLPLQPAITSHLDPRGNLWVEDSVGRVRLVTDAGTLSATTVPAAMFTHPFDQILGFAVDPVGDRLFGGQVSGAGILAWNAASTKKGDAGTQDFVLSLDNAQTMHVTGDRLYTSFFTSNIKVWNGISTVTGPKPFDFALTVDAGPISPSPSIRDQHVDHGTLVVSVQGTGMAAYVYLYANASAIAATSQPTSIVSHATFVSVKKAVLGADGTLYVLDSNGVSIFANALTAPAFKTEITTGITNPTDLLLLE